MQVLSFTCIDPNVTVVTSPSYLRVPNLPPFNSFTIICTVGKPAHVTTNVTVDWIISNQPVTNYLGHSVSIREGESEEVVIVLNVTNAVEVGHFVYQCEARLKGGEEEEEEEVVVYYEESDVIIHGKRGREGEGEIESRKCGREGKRRKD